MSEIDLARSVVTQNPADHLDDELKFLRIIYNNRSGPVTDQMLSERFNVQGERASLFIVYRRELISRGVIETCQIGGREVYDLTKPFRDLVTAEMKKAVAAATPLRQWQMGDPIRR